MASRRSCENGHFQMDESEIDCSTCHTEFRHLPENLTETMSQRQVRALERDFYKAILLRCTSRTLRPPLPTPVDKPELSPEPEIDPEDEFIRESGFTIILGPDDVCVDPNFRLTGPWVDSRGNPPPQRNVSRIPVIRLSREELLALPPGPVRPVPLAPAESTSAGLPAPVAGQRSQNPKPKPGSSPEPVPEPIRQEPNWEEPGPNTRIGVNNDSWRTYTTGGKNIFVNSRYKNPFIMKEPVFYATGWCAGPLPPGRGRNRNGQQQIRLQRPGPSGHGPTIGQNPGQPPLPQRNPLSGIRLPSQPGPPITLVRGHAPIGQQGSSPQFLTPDSAPAGGRMGAHRISQDSGSENWPSGTRISSPRGPSRGTGRGRGRGRKRSRGTGLGRGNP